MEKYYLKNGKEVKMGDSLVNKKEVKTKFGTVASMETIMVSKFSLPYLIKKGIVTTKECKEEEPTEVKVAEKIMANLCQQFGSTFDEVCGFLETVKGINEGAFLSIVYKKVAVECDKAYPDYIADSPKIYIISLGNDKIYETDKSDITSYRKFAAFRNPKEAELAIKVAKVIEKWVSEAND